MPCEEECEFVFPDGRGCGRRWNHNGDHIPHATAEPAPAREAIDHPPHYGGADNPYEAIKVIEAWGLGFRLGNCVKYISRAGRKPGKPSLKDLEKAKWYLEREIEKRHAST